jgi:hypothetical protein
MGAVRTSVRVGRVEPSRWGMVPCEPDPSIWCPPPRLQIFKVDVRLRLAFLVQVFGQPWPIPHTLGLRSGPPSSLQATAFGGHRGFVPWRATLAKHQCGWHKVLSNLVHRMSNCGLLLLARNLRARSEKILAQAEMMDDAEARLMMREVAASYDSLARRVEEHSFEPDKV